MNPYSRAAEAEAPIDLCHRVASESFLRTADGEWTSPLFQPAVPFDELIYSWHLARPDDTFRLYLQVRFGPGDESPWLYAGYWGTVGNRVPHREAPSFDRGVLDMDWLKLKARAAGFRFRVKADVGGAPLGAPPALTIITTDNHPSPEVARTHRGGIVAPPPASRILDVPLRRQMNSRGERMIDRCQSAALASAMEYFGKSVPLEQITAYTFDEEYEYPGIWPRVTAAAQEFGFDAAIGRFRDWDAVRRALAQNQVLLCSMSMKRGECQAPPYPSMGGHIVALCGVTDDGRVVVTDSFLGRSGAGYLCQWLQSDFEKVWMGTKGGVAMVIQPPQGASQRLVKDLPPFPQDRVFPRGDDH
ncbi:MAG: C39 family peptidase [Verrucomicrobiales bacterium]|nr:C39 family peptidase [Verrucomicrobiales bacterium]